MNHDFKPVIPKFGLGGGLHPVLDPILRGFDSVTLGKGYRFVFPVGFRVVWMFLAGGCFLKHPHPDTYYCQFSVACGLV